jgi:hypothetical protein
MPRGPFDVRIYFRVCGSHTRKLGIGPHASRPPRVVANGKPAQFGGVKTGHAVVVPDQALIGPTVVESATEWYADDRSSGDQGKADLIFSYVTEQLEF